MAVILNKRRITSEAYHLMMDAGILTEDDRVELLNGEIIEKGPIKSPHIGTVNWLDHHLKAMLAGKAIISIQNPIDLGEFSEPEPDLVICQMDEHYYRTRKITPEDIYLLIEVADTTLEKDREVKLPIYASSNIAEYWIINLQDQQVEIYTQPAKNLYKNRQIAT